MLNRAVFLDRDGVLNEAIVKNGNPYPPASKATVIIPDDVLDALKLLKKSGFLLIGASNQPDVARGTIKKEVVEEINQYLMTELPLDDFYVCYHDTQDACDCRKPLPGLLTQAAKKYNIDLSNSVMIGDRWKDIEAGKKAGCLAIFLDKNYEEKYASKLKPDFIAYSLLQAAQWISHNF